MKKVVIIGSGIGGIGLAALLKKSGDFDVTVLESHPYVGGKAASYERDGFKCDMGVHYCALGESGPLKALARKVGAEVSFVRKNPFMRLQEHNLAFDFSPSFFTPLNLIKLALLSRAHPKNVPGVLKMFLKILSVSTPQQAEAYDEIPLLDFLKTYIKDPKLAHFIEVFCIMLMVLPAEEASTGEFLYCFGPLAKSGSLSYPRGAFHSIPMAYKKVFEEAGGRVLVNEPVQAIRVENGRATGVVAKSGVFDADIVVSNAGIKKTVALAGQENFPGPFVSKVKKLKESRAAVTVKYALDKLPRDIPLYVFCPRIPDMAEYSRKVLEEQFVPENPHMFIPFPTVSDPSLAPPGKHILIAGGGMPEELSYLEMGERVLDAMENTLAKLFPGLEKHTLWKHRTNLDWNSRMGGRDTGDVIGLGQTYYQVGKNKPKPEMPVKGLWLVGCDAGGRGVGTEQAADSAMNVADMILKSVR